MTIDRIEGIDIELDGDKCLTTVRTANGNVFGLILGDSDLLNIKALKGTFVAPEKRFYTEQYAASNIDEIESLYRAALSAARNIAYEKTQTP